MGYTDQRSDLFRILLADDDDVHAFTMQCAINRLSTPCAFLRVENREVLARKVRTFEPELMVACGGFANEEELRQIRLLDPGSPIICLAKSPADAEASLSAGATDCILLSQEDRLGECIEKHLGGTFSEPDFRSEESLEPNSGLSKVEEKLEQLDRRIAAHLRELARSSANQWSRFRQAAKIGSAAGQSWVSQKYHELKVKYLVRKQRRLMQTATPLQNQGFEVGSAPAQPSVPLEAKIPLEIEISRKTVPNTKGDVRILTGEARQGPLDTVPKPAGGRSVHERTGDEENRDALRTMELSFKTLFHTALDATFLLDGLGSILHVNAAGCALLGAGASELLGKTLWSFVTPPQAAQISATWEAFLIEGQQKAELMFETVTGEQRDVFISARANLWFGVHLLVARDQTELKKLRAEVRSPRQQEAVNQGHQTSTGPFGTGMDSRCAEAGSMNEENSGAGR